MPCFDLPQEGSSKEIFAKCFVSWRRPLSAKSLLWAGWFEHISVASGYPVHFIWMKTCKMVTQESDFLWGSGSDEASETKSSGLKFYLPPLELSLSLLKPTLSLVSAGTWWAVNQVTKPSADPCSAKHITKMQIDSEMHLKGGCGTVLILASAVPNGVFLHSSSQNEMALVKVLCWGFGEK